MPKETLIPCLFGTLRQYGYDGATLSKISEATGLGKASLYHHFPGGKEQMVKAVLDYIESWLEVNILQKLQGAGDALSRMQQMCDRLTELYEGGRQPCVFAILSLGSARDVFHDQVKQLMEAWIEAMTAVLKEAGMKESVARQRAEEAAIAIQGALIVAQALDNPSIFERVVQELPQKLCQQM